MNIHRGKAFMICGMGGCSIAFDFFACISFIHVAYRFSVSWILLFRISAFGYAVLIVSDIRALYEHYALDKPFF